MPTQEVARAACPSALLGCGGARRPLLFDGGGVDSWLNGEARYAHDPGATLTVFASGWAHWRLEHREVWRWGDPLAQWEAFRAAGSEALGDSADGAGFLTVLSYELRHWTEALPRRRPWPHFPVLYCARYDWSYRASYRDGSASIGAATAPMLAERLRWYDRAVSAGSHAAPAMPSGGRRPMPACPRPTATRAEYRAMIERAHAYIAAGDVYEVNLAQQFTTAAQRADAAALFAVWIARDPMPFAAYVDGGNWIALANSPECFLRFDRERVTTWPIKGTRRRDRGTTEPAAGAALRSDPKECAEHIMVVDLERNDLGRVCIPGSVQVKEFAGVRHFRALAHMVSEVDGRLRPGTSAAALLRAVFPGGSITGAPKVRAMQIIDELEPSARGLYTGAIGWTEMDGASCFNIAIRTGILDDSGLTYWAGGGIVADSSPECEYEETLLKSQTFFRALATLERRSG